MTRSWFCVFLFAAAPLCACAQEPIVLRLILAVSRDTSAAQADALRGMRLGAAEAVRTAALFRAAVAVAEHPAGAGAIAPGSVTIAAGDAAECAGVAAAAAATNALVIDAACAASAIRECAPNVFRIAGASVAAADDSGADRIAGWHETFHRYGAAQLNDRYSAQYGSGMTDAAWRGWLAVKVAADAALRARSGAPAAVAAFFRSPRAHFDGHKGKPLRFDAARRLHSPAYAISREGELRELPFDTPREVVPCNDAG